MYILFLLPDDGLLLDEYKTTSSKMAKDINNKPYTSEDKLEEWRVDLTKVETQLNLFQFYCKQINFPVGV